MNAVWIKKKIGSYVTYNMTYVNKKAGIYRPLVKHLIGITSRLPAPRARGCGRHIDRWRR